MAANTPVEHSSAGMVQGFKRCSKHPPSEHRDVGDYETMTDNTRPPSGVSRIASLGFISALGSVVDDNRHGTGHDLGIVASGNLPSSKMHGIRMNTECLLCAFINGYMEAQQLTRTSIPRSQA